MDNHKLPPHRSSKLSQTKSVHPSSYSSRAFQRYQEHGMKCHDLSTYKLGIPIAIYSFPSIDWLWANWEQVIVMRNIECPMHVLVCDWYQCFFFWGGWNFAKCCTWKYDFNLYKVPFMGRKKTPNSSNFEDFFFQIAKFYDKF